MNQDFINKYYEDQDLDEDEIVQLFDEFNQDNISDSQQKGTNPHKKTNIVYKQLNSNFAKDIENDINLFKEINNILGELKLIDNDPKVAKIISQVKDMLLENNDRKIIIFSEYKVTIEHIKKYFEKEFPNQIFVVTGKLSGKQKKNYLTNLMLKKIKKSKLINIKFY